MATIPGGKWRRKNGKLTQVSEPTTLQRYGAHAEHPSKRQVEAPAEAPTAAPAIAKSSAKTAIHVEGKDDANAAT